MLLKPLFITFLLMCTAWTSMAFTLSGRITDQKTNEPVDAAYVFIMGTTYVTLSDKNGDFALQISQPGSYQMVISHIGYETTAIDILVDTNISGYAISVVPKNIKLNDVTVTAKDLYKDFNTKVFKEALLGNTPNAKHCQLKEPLKVNFERRKFTPKNEMDSSTKSVMMNINKELYLTKTTSLLASSDDFITITNKALGYILRYKLVYFQTNPNGITYSGYPYFEDIIDTYWNKKRIYKNRIETYEGSSQHFFNSLYNNTLEQEGFTVFKLYEEVNPDSVKSSKRFSYYNQTTQNYHLLYPVQEFVNLGDDVTNDSLAYAKHLNYCQSFEVAYNQKPDIAYWEYYNNTLGPNWQTDDSQNSLFIKFDPTIPITFYNNGNFNIGSHNLKMVGYMAWKRLADLLPHDFDAEATLKELSNRGRKK